MLLHAFSHQGGGAFESKVGPSMTGCIQPAPVRDCAARRLNKIYCLIWRVARPIFFGVCMFNLAGGIRPPPWNTRDGAFKNKVGPGPPKGGPAKPCHQHPNFGPTFLIWKPLDFCINTRLIVHPRKISLPNGRRAILHKDTIDTIGSDILSKH